MTVSAFDAAWSVLKGENIHPSARLHAEMGAAGMSMDPPQPKREGGQLEPRDAFKRRVEQYQQGMQAAQDRARAGEGMPSGVERMPRDDIVDIMDRYARAYEQYSYHSNAPDHNYIPMTRGEYGYTLRREHAVDYHGNKVQEIEDEYAAKGGNPEDFNRIAFAIQSKHRGL